MESLPWGMWFSTNSCPMRVQTRTKITNKNRLDSSQRIVIQTVTLKFRWNITILLYFLSFTTYQQHLGTPAPTIIAVWRNCSYQDRILKKLFISSSQFEEIVQTNHIGTVAVVTCLRVPVHLHLCRAPPRIFRLRIRHQTDGVSVSLSVCEHVPFHSESVSVHV